MLNPEVAKELLPLLVDYGLDVRQREVMNGLYWEGVGLKTIARRLGLSVRQVRRIREQAHNLLRLQIEAVERRGVDG